MDIVDRQELLWETNVDLYYAFGRNKRHLDTVKMITGPNSYFINFLALSLLKFIDECLDAQRSCLDFWLLLYPGD